ncbi:MAG: hypothetical protein Q8O99_04945 [bacterium]|nr:hypothetical protein [bacterium]
MQTSVVDLTYTTCTGSYLVSGTDVVTTTIHSGQAYNDTSTPVGTIQAHISGLLLARFTT